MIIITSLIEREYHVCDGDEFHLSIRGVDKENIVISEEINITGIINYIASFRFAQDNGKCIGFNLCGFFGNKDYLPKEIKEAVMVKDLTGEQKANFIETCGTIMKGEAT